MKTITIEQLAEKLNGNIWARGDLKRIYLDEGYNTKKMSTKTFVFQDESGDFQVSCHVDCPSQPWQWCKYQEEEVKESVYNSIEEAVQYLEAENVYYFIDSETKEVVDVDGKKYDLNYLTENSDYFYSEISALKAKKSSTGITIVSIPIKEFEAEVKRLEDIAGTLREQKAAEDKVKKETENSEKIQAAKEETDRLKNSGAIAKKSERVKHAKFGEGVVLNSDSKMIEILFDNSEFGLKKLMTEYVKLEIINND